MYLSVRDISFELLQLEISFSVYRYILAISGSSLSIKVIGSRSNFKNAIFYLTIAFMCMYLIKTYLKSQGHLKVKVKHTQYQGQMKEDQFPLCCKHFCDLCFMWMVSLRLKGILVCNVIKTLPSLIITSFLLPLFRMSTSASQN